MAPTRLSKADRRAQLLDIAADLLLSQGAGALTMERLAQQAGVSKALPYLHFDNAEAVLVALYRREVAHLGAQITSAVAGAPDRRAAAEAAVHAYFDTVAERGAIFAVLAAPGSAVPHLADGGSRQGVRYVQRLFVDALGMTTGQAGIAAPVVTGAIAAAVDAWAHRQVSRADAEAAVVGVVLHLAGACA